MSPATFLRFAPICFALTVCFNQAGVKADEVAIAELTAKAGQGNAQAQFELGQLYSKGAGVTEDDARALELFQKAAAQGHTQAETSLGFCYSHGIGVPQDFAESIRLYRLAAAKGDSAAQYRIGNNYALGRELPQDKAEAARWLRKSADQGYPLALYDLGRLYASGEGVPQSDFETFVLISLALELQTPEQNLNHLKMEDILAQQKEAEQKLSDAQKAEAAQRIATFKALVAVHPRKFGAPGMIGHSRGWWVWKSWNPETWEAQITSDPPGDVFKVKVLPWVTTYRHLAYGARIDALLPGEKMNMFFDPSAEHRRGYVVHFQDEISQMKGHGHFWKVREVTDPHHFTAQVFAGDTPLDDKVHAFEVDPACKKWVEGKLSETFPLKADDKLYMTWVYDGDRRMAKLLTDDASLDTLKALETERIHAEVSAEGMAGQVDTVGPEQVQFLVYSSYWAQSGKLQPGQQVHLATTGPGYRPTDLRIPATVVSQKNRGMYGSGVNDVLLTLDNPADADRLRELAGQVLRLIPGKSD